VKVVNFDVCEWPQNLGLTDYNSNVPWAIAKTNINEGEFANFAQNWLPWERLLSDGKNRAKS